MKRFTYTPQIKAYINITSGNAKTNPNYGKVIDVSEDIIRGSVTHRLNAISTATLTLQNKNGKYLGGYKNSDNDTRSGYVFTPMDRIIIGMARIGDPFQVFSGYLDEVPAFQLYPDAITIQASCTLKRLLYTYFDPGLPAMIQYFAKWGYAYDPNTGILSDPNARFGNWGIYGGVGELIYNVLHDIGSWDRKNVRILGLPSSFVKAIESATGNFNTSSAYTPGGQDNSQSSDQGSSTPEENPYTANLPKNQSEKIDVFMNKMIKAGFSVEDAAAFTGNFIQESSLNPARKNPTSNAFGIAQWLGSRKSRLFSFAGKESVYDIDVQINYVIYELNSTHRRARDIIKEIKTGSVEQIINLKTEAVCLKYEIPGENETYLEQRKSYARLAYKIYSGSSLKSTSTPEPEKAKTNTILSIAKTQVGARENPPGSNRGDVWRDGGGVDNYLIAAGKQNSLTSATSSEDRQWCAAFIYWVFQKAGIANKIAKTALVRVLWEQALKDGIGHPIGTIVPKPGDIVIFGRPNKEFSHAGIIVSVNGNTLNIIDGNSGSGQDQVAESRVDDYTKPSRTGRVVKGFIRATEDSNVIGTASGAASANADYVAEATQTTNTDEYAGSTSRSAGTDTLANGFVFQQLSSRDSTLSYLLSGKHALANDIPLMEWIRDLVTGAGRVFCSAPNGDFYSFFPDYFGWFDSTPYFKISDIEIIDLQVQLTDTDPSFATHVYGVGPLIGYTQITPIDYAASAIASVQEDAFKFFIKTNNKIHAGPDRRDPQDIVQDFSSDNFDPDEFIARYGARPVMKPLNNIRNPALLWMATWMEFMKGWANRYKAQAQFTFLPELFPGGRVNVANRLTMFINSVTHNFDMANGFSTTAELIAPSVDGDNLEGEAERTVQSGAQVGK